MNPLFRRIPLFLSLFFLASASAVKAQKLSDVILSLTDRQKVLTQKDEVRNELTSTNEYVPGPIEWAGAGSNPNETGVNGLDVGGQIRLLQQAVDEFDRIKKQYVKVDPDDIVANKIGYVDFYGEEDFDPLPPVSPGNFKTILIEMSDRIRALEIVRWPFETTYSGYGKGYAVNEEEVDPAGEAPPYIVISPEGVVPNWSLPETIGPDMEGESFSSENLPFGFGPDFAYSSVRAAGSYFEQQDWYERGIVKEYDRVFTLRMKSLSYYVEYPSSVRILLSGPPGGSSSIGGKAFIIRRNNNYYDTVSNPSAELDPEDGNYVVEGSSRGGILSLSAPTPNATIHGEWLADPSSPPYQYFHQGLSNPDYQTNHYQGYGRHLAGATYLGLFIPEFNRGVDSMNFKNAVDVCSAITAPAIVEVKAALHPRPTLLFGFDMGNGLSGVSKAYIGAGAFTNSSEWAQYSLGLYYGHPEPFNRMPPRFDSSYGLAMFGSHVDFHVVYDNDRTVRTQAKPSGPGWPVEEENSHIETENTALEFDWDRPRLRQVAGRDVVADVTYNAAHYGGYSISFYQRKPGGADPVPGETVGIAGLNLISKWDFSSPHGAQQHPNVPEHLVAVSTTGESLDLKANFTLSNNGLGYPYKGESSANGQMAVPNALILGAPPYDSNYPHAPLPASFSWTLVHSAGGAEKSRKEIQIDHKGNNQYEGKVSESLDGSPLVSTTTKQVISHPSDSPVVWPFSPGQTMTWNGVLGSSSLTGSRSMSEEGAMQSLALQYAGAQPDVSAAWDSNGLLSSWEQGAVKLEGSMDGAAYKLVKKLDGSAVSTEWYEMGDGGKSLRRYVAPDGSAASKTAPGVAWSEVEYGTATDGVLGLPHRVRNSDGTGSTYAWNVAANGSYTVTVDSGLLNGDAVSRGTRIIAQVNAYGFPVSTETFALLAGGTVKTGGMSYSDHNAATGAPGKGTDFITGRDATFGFDAKGRITAFTDPLGLASTFGDYDFFNRPKQTSSNGISGNHIYSPFSTNTTFTGSISGSTSATVDGLGRMTGSTLDWRGVASATAVDWAGNGGAGVGFSNSVTGTSSATLQPNGGVSAAASPAIPFGSTTGGLTVENGLLKNASTLSAQSAATTTTWADAWGRARAFGTPSASGQGMDVTNVTPPDPASTLRRVVSTDAAGRKSITENDPYHSSGAVTRSGIDVNGDGSLGSGDRYIESITSASGGGVVTTLSLTEEGRLREILRTTWTPAGNVTVTTINGNEETITRTPDYAAKTITTTSTKGWSKTESFNNLGLTTSSALTGTGVPATALNPAWRADGSLSGVSLTIAGETHAATFNNDGTLASLTAPGKGNILGGHSIAGGMETLAVDGVTATRKLDGTQISLDGSDTADKTESLAVHGGGFKSTIAPVAGAATTTDLNAAGTPTAKNYAAGAGESYTFLPGGLLQSVSLARGGATVFGYSQDGARDLVSVSQPALSSGAFQIAATTTGFSYDVAGRISAVADASGSRGLLYQNGRLAETAWGAGSLATYRINRSLDPQGRDLGFFLFRGENLIHPVAKAVNGVSDQVFELASGGIKVSVSRDAAGRITGFEWGPRQGAAAVTQAWTRGAGGQITAASSNVTGAPSFAYTQHDAAGRRLTATTAGGDWTYQYAGGQLVSAVHPAFGSFGYGFDGIGRRTDMGAANTSDLLNRTLAWTNDQTRKVKITAVAGARVWFNGAEIENFDGIEEKAVAIPGPDGGWVGWETLAVLEGAGEGAGNPPANPHASPDAKAEKKGATWVPPATEAFTYDAAGNRESSALWDYGWNAKNELVRARTKNHDATPQGWDLTYAYDSEGRRFSKHVVRYLNGVKQEEKHITYIWDGWDLVYERHQLPSGLTVLERKYLWGPDIAGGGAGGAGGLLLIRETRGETTTEMIPLYDGSGHVVALTNLDKTLLASYAYGPFGEKIHATGPLAQSNPWRYATKYLDEETGLYYFGKRHFDPTTGQWLSREPLGESESLNLYSYCHNDPLNHVDVLGLAPKWMTGDQAKVYDEMIAEWIGKNSRMSPSQIHADVIRAMTLDGTLTEKVDAGGRGNWEREVLKNYLSEVGNAASRPGAGLTAQIVGGGSDVAGGLIGSLPGGGPAGSGASDGSNTTPMLVVDTFRSNMAGLISLANFHSPVTQRAMGNFMEGYNAKYSYGQRTTAQSVVFLAPFVPKGVSGVSKSMRISPALERMLHPSFAGRPGFAPGHVLNPFGRAANTAPAEIPTIGGRLPINSRFADQTHPFGIQFTEQGFPNFGQISKAEVQLKGLTGNYAKDAAMANQAVGLVQTPKGFVWHHVEDGATMQLIPQSIHNAIRHTGGAAVIRNGGLFDQ
ncbi:MAG: RHS repeat-associated core domain-containing protein [Verrucomicrobiota bacterium]